MSALGHKQTCAVQLGMSALGQKRTSGSISSRDETPPQRHLTPALQEFYRTITAIW